MYYNWVLYKVRGCTLDYASISFVRYGLAQMIKCCTASLPYGLHGKAAWYSMAIAMKF